MPSNYVFLEKVTVGAATAASITFTSIPQTGYTDLVIKASPRGTVAEDGFGIRFNSDSGSNYTFRALVGQGSAASSFSGTSSYIPIGRQTESTQTANTFGNTEFYIPNYTSSNQKSVSVDAVNENNGTVARAQIGAGLWTGTASITTIQVLPGSGSFAANSTFYLYGVAKFGVEPVITPKATGGNIITTDGTYWYHAFLSSGTFTPTTGLSCEVLVVAGGGAAGNSISGGGGAGGLRGSTLSLNTTGYTVVVGGGGATSGASIGRGGSGSVSSISTIESAGGGGGGGDLSAPVTPANGGSGGGAKAFETVTVGLGNTPSTSPSQGNNGGAGGPAFTGAVYPAGGGGGAGAVGATGASGVGGAGGVGSNAYSTWASVTGTGASGYFAGGGGGGCYNANNFGAGGLGGGGAGASSQGISGTANTGGGGGGSGNGSTLGGAGGSGIVIVRYAV